MKRLPLFRIELGLLLSPRTPYQCCSFAALAARHHDSFGPHNLRSYATKKKTKAKAASKALKASSSRLQTDSSTSIPSSDPPSPPLESLPSPPPYRARTSAKLAALHARLSLPARVPLETLARTLIDPTADASPVFNNASLAVLGGDLLGYYTAEHIICKYPRLPMAVLFAAQYAYVGPAALAAITKEWGVEMAAFPGGELDPGLLQLRRVPPGTEPPPVEMNWSTEKDANGRRTARSRIIYGDEFGNPRRATGSDGISAWGPALKPAGDIAGGSKGRLLGSTGDKHVTLNVPGTTVEDACRNFVRAVMGAVYLHAGTAAAKAFFAAHFLPRRLDMASLFEFQEAPRDLSRLCAREGFESPVARLISETGRRSRHPVFVVGVYSGRDKLGEGAGASLNEARFRASTAALKGWYLYSPLQTMVPSATEGLSEEEKAKRWKPQMVDMGEVIS